MVGRALVAVEAVIGLGVDDDLVVGPRRRERVADRVDLILRNHRVLAAEITHGCGR